MNPRAVRVLARLHRIQPVKVVLIGYLSYLLIGWLLLSLPFAWQSAPVPAIDNLFVSASAMSTTGLSTVNPPQAYSFWGELIILGLMQVGGLGYMTLGSFVILAGAERLSKFRQGVTRVAFTLPNGFQLGKFLGNVVAFTLIVELVGAAALYVAFRQAGVGLLAGPGDDIGASGTGQWFVAWAAIFHSVSAFCTAGFSIFPDSLEAYRDNLPINFIVSALSLIGALGFIVLSDFFWTLTGSRRRITLTSRIILRFSLWILVIGTIALFLCDQSIHELPPSQRLLTAFFQVMSSMTTVGFNSHPIGEMSLASAWLLCVIMLVGASPSGTGGGLKTTSVSALLATMRSVIKGRDQITFWGQRVPRARLDTAFAALGFYVLFILIGGFGLMLTEAAGEANFEDLTFEVFSALGTVGISRGITADLSPLGKLVITALMFVGRLGPLTLGLALFSSDRRPLRGEDDLAV